MMYIGARRSAEHLLAGGSAKWREKVEFSHSVESSGSREVGTAVAVCVSAVG